MKHDCKHFTRHLVSLILLIVMTASCVALPAGADLFGGPDRGNSTGNIVNIGFGYAYSDRTDFVDGLNHQFVNIYDGYLYYVDQSKGGRLFRRSLSGGKAERLSKSTDTAYVNVIDDTIFFVDVPAGYKITRMELDGSCREQLCNLSASRLCAYDGYLYFANWKGDNSGLWRIDYYGGSKQQLTYGDIPLFINVTSDGIYWISNDEKCICKTTFGGSTTYYRSIRKMSSLNMYGGYAYFVWDGPSGYGIYRSADLKSASLVYQAGKKEKNIDCLNVCNGCIIFRVNGGQKSNKTDGRLMMLTY